METTIKTVHKLLDKLILPKYDDIAEYHIILDDNTIEITFWMDGTEQEVEEEIAEECRSVLSMLGSDDYHFIFKFTTEGEHFYIYS
jgi:uncharacterized membrane protein